MPPKRTKLSKEELRDLIERYQINFEGPVQPKSWPESYKSLFLDIRQIGATRYDEYMGAPENSTSKRRRIVESTLTRVRDLRDRACEARQDVETTESTWRSRVESIIRDRFSAAALWWVLKGSYRFLYLTVDSDRCKNEKWTPEYRAKPFGEENLRRVKRKRAQRRPCNCHLNISSPKTLLDERYII
jgi:hypothetical protein